MPPPWADNAAEAAAIIQNLEALRGRAIARVAYLDPQHGDPLWHAFDGVHEANVGVELELVDGAFSAVWSTSGYDEGLSVGPGKAEARFGRYDLQRSDVSGLDGWSEVIGSPVADVRVGWHRPGNSTRDAVFAVRLCFEAARATTIALGKTAGSVLEYLPDEVVVIFDDERAQAYWNRIATRAAD